MLLIHFLRQNRDKAIFTKCAGCHGTDGKTKALGKSAVIAGQLVADLETKILEYKVGTRNVNGMGILMKGQVFSLSDKDLKNVAEYISSLNTKTPSTRKNETKEVKNKSINTTGTKSITKDIKETPKSKIIDTSNWYVSIEKSLMGDSKTVFLSTDGANDAGITASLNIRCKNNKTSLFISYSYTFMGTDGQTARIKFDNNKPYKKWVSGSSDGTALFYNKPIPFIKKVMKHKIMIFEASPYSKISTQTKFNISNLDKVISPLRKECKW